jgi:hypothetical protein
LFSVIAGLIFFYKSIKSKIKLLSYAALMLIFGWLFLLGNCIDFITIIITGRNTPLPEEFVAILNFVWVVPSGFCSYIYCTAIIIPEKKQLKRFIYLFIIINYFLYEFFLILDPLGSSIFIYPSVSGNKLINYYFNIGSIAPIFIFIPLPVYLGLCGCGFLHKSIHSTGVLKKKYFIISLGIFLYSGFGAAAGIGLSGIFVIVIRIGLFLSILFWYLGLREEPAEKIKVKVKKEIKVEDGLIRLIKRPSQITEEEVSISKEKKICLVCKGSIGGFSFICNDCGTFYCQNCANSLITLENACWVCNTPIDPSKPSKPYEKEKEDLKVTISEEIEKEPME